jgi:hypothetical protein
MNCHPDPELAEGEESQYFAQSVKNMGYGPGMQWSFGSASFLCIGNSLHLLHPFLYLAERRDSTLDTDAI